VPFDQTQGQAHRAFRTLTLTATPRGETPPPSVRYLIDSAAPVTPHTPGATCHGERPMECYVSGPAPYELRIELNPPMMFSDDIQAEPDVHITAATWDGAVWTEWDSADWSLTFRHCDRSFTDHLAQLIRQRDGLGHSAERLTRMTRPIDSLPGDRLFPGPIRAARPAPGDLRDMGADGASAILASQVSDLARTRGLDSYLSGAGGLPEAVRAIERYGYLRQCNPERTADLQAALDDQHAAVRRQLAWWRALQRDAQAGRAAWTRRVQEDMAVFDATRLTTPPPDVGEVLERLSRNYTTSKVHQLLTMLATAWDTGATAALRAPLTALGAGLALAQLVGGAIDYDTLLDIEAGVTEATAWMEAEAYLDGLTHRYEEAEALISAAITVTREAERANCTCFRP
jgi:hypothetical protein